MILRRDSTSDLLKKEKAPLSLTAFTNVVEIATRLTRLQDFQHTSHKTYSASKTITIPVPRSVQAPSQSSYPSQDIFRSTTISIEVPRRIRVPRQYPYQSQDVFGYQDNTHTSPKTYAGSKTIGIPVPRHIQAQRQLPYSPKTHSGTQIISIPVSRSIQAPKQSPYQSQDVFRLLDNHHTSPKTYSDTKSITIQVPRSIQTPRQLPYQSQDVFSLQDNQHTSLKASTQTVLRTTQMARRRLSSMTKQRATQKAAKETKTTLQSLCPISYEKIFTPERIQSLSTINPLYHEFTLQKKVCQNYSGK
ncbi:hypothetical protein CHS0354_013826 [Potamilus streckersoni]|uniref:Uncharacterized protein n=1 Tax=Potamilus streckersoni TaxID=2493646 RepID=A0AAE0SHR0_9BIVA|nr:hypothetical protein CHS0354_013826 [Potamilus streckersoni]